MICLTNTSKCSNQQRFLYLNWLGIHTGTIGRIFSPGYLLKTISINCSTSNLPEEVIQFGASKNWPKKIKMGIWWMKCTWRYLDIFNIFWEIKKNLNKHKLMHKLIYTIWSLIKHNAKQKQKREKLAWVRNINLNTDISKGQFYPTLLVAEMSQNAWHWCPVLFKPESWNHNSFLLLPPNFSLPKSRIKQCHTMCLGIPWS